MYDELIKALRDPAHSLDCEFCDSRYCHPDRKGYGKCIIIKAADAIENMSEAYDKLSRHMDDLAALMPRWIPVEEDTPGDFISVQAHMTDAGNFPSVREAYVVNKNWFFPALKEFHPVDMWKRFDEPPKEE